MFSNETNELRKQVINIMMIDYAPVAAILSTQLYLFLSECHPQLNQPVVVNRVVLVQLSR